MIPPKQPLYTMPPQASSPYPGLGSFLSPSDLQSYRGHPHPSLSRTLSSKPMLPSISASPPPSFQISPPLHQQLSLHHPQSSILNQPLSMQQVPQQPILSPSMALQVQPPMNSSPPGQQVSGWVLKRPFLNRSCMFIACLNVILGSVSLMWYLLILAILLLWFESYRKRGSWREWLVHTVCPAK